MAEKKRIPRTLSYALTGWLGGALSVFILGIAWTQFFPAILRPERYYGPGPGLLQIMLMAILVATPAALVGGIIGGRASVEGGESSQRFIAIVFGSLFSLPFSCYILWVFTGF